MKKLKQRKFLSVDIKHYHAENGNFRSAQWLNHYKDINKGPIFAGVNAYHQNGQEEHCIR